MSSSLRTALDEVKPMSEYRGLNSGRPDVSSGDAVDTSADPVSESAGSLPGAAALLRAGFEPIESFTGSTWVATVWPDAHRRELPETRPDRSDDPTGGVVWFVRSPWPSIGLADAVSIVWANLSREEPDWATEAARILAWSEARAQAALVDLPK